MEAATEGGRVPVPCWYREEPSQLPVQMINLVGGWGSGVGGPGPRWPVIQCTGLE